MNLATKVGKSCELEVMSEEFLYSNAFFLKRLCVHSMLFLTFVAESDVS